ncbi:MAG: hypothetical protein V1743_04500 [Nanoarchaeota archaeon]
MYGWGPEDTKTWRKPGGYKYDSARSPYLDKLAADSKAKGPRTYTRRSSPGKLVDPRGKEISSESQNPLIVAIDVTGSMSAWPAEIFDRLPLMYQTLSQYRPDLEICFAAIGDATCDNYPLQVNHFGKGVDLEEHIKAMCPEGHGGGQISESYELFGYYILEHCKTPKATSPFLLIYGDEKFYNQIAPDQVAHYIGDKMQGPRDSNEVWKALMQRFNLFYLQKPYNTEDTPHIDEEVRNHWAGAIGKQRIINLDSAERAVDIAMALIAKQWGQYSDFKENLGSRQLDPAVRESVYSSVRYIPDATATTSKTTTSRKGKTTPSLSMMYDDAKR